jgi:hypothetical protein
MRLGLPPEQVEWLVDLDIGGKTYIKTPYAVHKTMQSKKHMVSTTDITSFIEECGVRQRDTQGPQAFNSVEDILQTMLALDKAYNFYIRDDNQRLSAQAPITFADDTSTTAATQKALQRQADIICAFSTITGLRVEPKNMFSVVWSNSIHTPQNQTLITLASHINSHTLRTYTSDVWGNS